MAVKAFDDDGDELISIHVVHLAKETCLAHAQSVAAGFLRDVLKCDASDCQPDKMLPTKLRDTNGDIYHACFDQTFVRYLTWMERYSANIVDHESCSHAILTMGHDYRKYGSCTIKCNSKDEFLALSGMEVI